MLIIEPPPIFFISGTMCFIPKKWAMALVSMKRCQSSTVESVKPEVLSVIPIPALFTRISIFLNFLSPWATASIHSSSFVTSNFSGKITSPYSSFKASTCWLRSLSLISVAITLAPSLRGPVQLLPGRSLLR